MTRTAEIEFEMATTYDPTTHPHDYLFQHPDYREQDEARLKAWLNDDWYFLAAAPRPPSRFRTAPILNAGLPPNCCRLV
jgi:hypothetical protein